MGHAIKHIKKRSVKFDREENFLTFEALAHSFDRFPSFCDIFRETHSTLLSGNGPLSEANRHFIAWMACKAIDCELLTQMEEQCFLRTGGNATWLSEPSSVPTKLRRLESLSLLMTKSSSFINYKHFKKLTEGDDNWTLAELVQALVIIVYFHALSTVPIAMNTNQRTENESTIFHTKEEQELHQISENLEVQGIVTTDFLLKQSDKELKRKRSFSEGEVLNKSQSTKKLSKHISSDVTTAQSCFKNLSNLIRIQDYCWDAQGFSVLSTFYSDIAVLLDDKFRAARKLSPKNDQALNEKEKFRTAVWNFVQSMFGIHHDDYNYKEINEALDEDLKDFIRLSCDARNLYSESDLKSQVGRSFDRVFVSILVMEARFQSELLYVLKAVMKHMS